MVDFFLDKKHQNAKRIVADIILKELGSDDAKMVMKKLKRVQQKRNRSARVASSKQIELEVCAVTPGKHAKKNRKRKEARKCQKKGNR
jgi:hypothetical protein